MRRQVIWSGIVAALLTVVLVAIALNALHDAPSGSEPQAATSKSAQGGAGVGDAGTEGASPSVGTRPNCPAGPVAGVELDCLGGAAGGRSADHGVTIVNVWAWWCEPCRDEIGYLDRLAAAHPDWQVVGVHADANAANGAAFLNELGATLPSFQDSHNTFAGTLGLPGVIPITLVVVDGKVTQRFIQAFKSADELDAAVAKAVGAAGGAL